MKQKLFLFATSMFIGVGMSAQWTAPVPTASDFQASEGEDTVFYYIYNKDAGMFYTEGNDWGTRASVGKTGLKTFISKYQAKAEDGESLLDWDGRSYILNNYSINKGRWDKLFFDGNQADVLYVDMGNRINDCLFEWVKNGDSYRFYGAEANSIVNPTNFPGAFLGVDRSANADNTVVTADIYKAEEPTPNTYLVDWQFITEDNYVAYLEKYEVYDASETLKKAIEEAKEKNVSVPDAEAVYANTNSTKAELEYAVLAVKEAIANALENSASPNNPKDMTAEFVVNSDFEGGNVNGWTTTTGAQNNKTTKSDTEQFAGFVGNFYENWNGSPFSGKMYQVLRNVPKGIYTLEMGAFCNAGSGAYVYANGDSVEVVSSNARTYTVTTLVDVDTLEIGLKQSRVVSNWMGLDNVRVTYYGNSDASYKMWVEGLINDAPDFNNPDEYTVQAATLEAYNAVLDAVKVANTKAEVLAVVENFKKALAETTTNADAYAAYINAMKYGDETMAKGFEGLEADILSDYLMMEEEPSEDNPYGTAQYIVNNPTLSTEQITEETTRLLGMIEYVIKNCLGPDMDATDFIKNPNFDYKSTSGWSHNTSLSAPVAGGLESNPCVEVYGNNFDSYQILIGVPNGVYELSVQAFYRTCNSTTTAYNEYKSGSAREILTEIYVNGQSAPVCDIASETFSENIENNCSEVETGVFVPNGMNSASNAFSQGKYFCSVMGVVTDGTMRVGIRSNGSEGGRWSLWDNFRLTYRAYNPETIAKILEPLIEEVSTFQRETEAVGKVEADKLKSERGAAQDALAAQDGQAMFKAYSSLSNALADAKASAKIYADLTAANDELGEVMGTSTAAQATLDAANALVDEVSNALDGGEYTIEEATAKIDEIKEMITKLNIPEEAENASDENPVDMTALIVNPGFDVLDDNGNATANGWSGTAPSGINTENTNAEFYYSKVKTYDMYQTINGLHDGTYKVTVQAFYRAGTSAEDYRGALANSADSLHAFLYATSGEETASIPVQHLGSGAKVGGYNGGTDESSVAEGVYVPYTMATGAMAFAEGAYVNSLIIKVTGNKLTIGLKKNESLNADWTLFDNWTLTYYGANSAQTPNGDASGIEGVVSDATVVSVAYYTLGGARIAAPNKGINIVKTVLSDGTVNVSKVLVK